MLVKGAPEIENKNQGYVDVYILPEQTTCRAVMNLPPLPRVYLFDSQQVCAQVYIEDCKTAVSLLLMN